MGFPEMRVPQYLDGLFHGKIYQNMYYVGTPILGNLQMIQN